MYNPKTRLFSGGVQAVDYTPTAAALNAGDPIVINGVVYIANTDIAQNVAGAASFAGGVWAGNKASGAWNVGDEIYWNPTASPNVGTASTGAYQNTPAGEFVGYCVATPGTTAGALTADQWGYFVKSITKAAPVGFAVSPLPPTTTTNVAGAAQVAGSIQIPAGLQVGDIVRLRGQLQGVTRTSTDTTLVTLSFGSTTIVTLASAFAHATTNFLWFDVDFLITAVGTGGTAVAAGLVSGGTVGATMLGVAMASTTFNTTIAETFSVNVTFSANNQTDAISLNIFEVQIIRA